MFSGTDSSQYILTSSKYAASEIGFNPWNQSPWSHQLPSITLPDVFSSYRTDVAAGRASTQLLDFITQIYNNTHEGNTLHSYELDQQWLEYNTDVAIMEA